MIETTRTLVAALTEVIDAYDRAESRLAETERTLAEIVHEKWPDHLGAR